MQLPGRDSFDVVWRPSARTTVWCAGFGIWLSQRSGNWGEPARSAWEFRAPFRETPAGSRMPTRPGLTAGPLTAILQKLLVEKCVSKMMQTALRFPKLATALAQEPERCSV